MPELKRRLAPIAALLLLCLIWAWASLRPELLAHSPAGINAPPLMRESMLLALFAALAGVAASIRKRNWPRGRMLGTAILVGLGLFVVPALLNEFGSRWIDDSTRVALFSLAPVFAVVFEPHLTRFTPEHRTGLTAALAATAGTLLVFPLNLPHSGTAGLAFCGVLVSVVSVAAANCLAVSAGQEPRGSMLSFAAITSGSAALCLGALGIFRHSGTSAPFDAWVIPDLFALALLFWLMRRMSAVRMTTRFVIAPLLANLIGLAFLQPHVQLQAWLGLLLIALGSGWLLFAPEDLSGAKGTMLGIE